MYIPLWKTSHHCYRHPNSGSSSGRFAAFYIALVLALRVLGFGDVEHSERLVRGLSNRPVPGYSASEAIARSPEPPPAPVDGHSHAPGLFLLLTPFVWLVRFEVMRPESSAIWAALPGALGHVLCAVTLIQIWLRCGQVPGAPWSALAPLAFARSGILWRDAMFCGDEGGVGKPY